MIPFRAGSEDTCDALQLIGVDYNAVLFYSVEPSQRTQCCVDSFNQSAVVEEVLVAKNAHDSPEQRKSVEFF